MNCNCNLQYYCICFSYRFTLTDQIGVVVCVESLGLCRDTKRSLILIYNFFSLQLNTFGLLLLFQVINGLLVWWMIEGYFCSNVGHTIEFPILLSFLTLWTLIRFGGVDFSSDFFAKFGFWPIGSLILASLWSGSFPFLQSQLCCCSQFLRDKGWNFDSYLLFWVWFVIFESR